MNVKNKKNLRYETMKKKLFIIVVFSCILVGMIGAAQASVFISKTAPEGTITIEQTITEDSPIIVTTNHSETSEMPSDAPSDGKKSVLRLHAVRKPDRCGCIQLQGVLISRWYWYSGGGIVHHAKADFTVKVWMVNGASFVERWHENESWEGPILPLPEPFYGNRARKPNALALG